MDCRGRALPVAEACAEEPEKETGIVDHNFLEHLDIWEKRSGARQRVEVGKAAAGIQASGPPDGVSLQVYVP